MSDVVTVIAPINIAVIKYWGKRDEKLKLPLNDSISGTLDANVMCSKTSVCARPEFKEDRIWLNGAEQSKTILQNCLQKIKDIACDQQSVEKEFLSWNVHICSENNFPTAAGLASSASGYACLVTALAKLYKIKADLSALARIGSGSACRSIYGGFVHWHAGIKPDGSDSFATQVVNTDHWPEMRVLVLVVGDSKKHTSSSIGMKITAKTSALMKYRTEINVPLRVTSMCDAIKQKDFASFAEITMKDSNEFHAVCLSAYPPCVYLNDISHKIINLIHKYNDLFDSPKVAYTFDAGPNACLYLLEKDVPNVVSMIKHVFPSTNPDFIKGLPCNEAKNVEFLNNINFKQENIDLLKYMIYTKIGDGPKVIDNGEHLLNVNGYPLEK
ncbi:unnamed protein product [Leptidea sinapis]|uniref:Diphosphomevalonate decarboxylase n=1 Tax=Leptidea sinapis TaxID=189913 RepID=A0A5E4PUX9_9NEOP|nr:unnamed protein product [Leptidea sinapis]